MIYLRLITTSAPDGIPALTPVAMMHQLSATITDATAGTGVLSQGTPTRWIAGNPESDVSSRLHLRSGCTAASVRRPLPLLKPNTNVFVGQRGAHQQKCHFRSVPNFDEISRRASVRTLKDRRSVGHLVGIPERVYRNQKGTGQDGHDAGDDWL
jgi:hypothetical protein